MSLCNRPCREQQLCTLPSWCVISFKVKQQPWLLSRSCWRNSDPQSQAHADLGTEQVPRSYSVLGSSRTGSEGEDSQGVIHHPTHQEGDLPATSLADLPSSPVGSWVTHHSHTHKSTR